MRFCPKPHHHGSRAPRGPPTGVHQRSAKRIYVSKLSFTKSDLRMIGCRKAVKLKL